MPRARWIKPEFFRDRVIAKLGPVPALVFQALWIWADDGGVAQCDADRIKGEVFHLWPTISEQDIADSLKSLEESRRICRYTEAGDQYATILNFHKHQKVHQPSKFRHPRPKDCGSTEAALPPYSPPRHLDTKTPRHPDAVPSAAGVSKGNGNGTPLPTTVFSPGYLTRCVVALNAGLAENPHLRDIQVEVPASTQAGKVSWEADGVPIAVAEQAVRDKARAFVPTKPRDYPRSLKYFDAIVREAWELARQAGIKPTDPNPRLTRWRKENGFPT